MSQKAKQAIISIEQAAEHYSLPDLEALAADYRTRSNSNKRDLDALTGLALVLQRLDIIRHEGGKYQDESKKAFERAIKLVESSSSPDKMNLKFTLHSKYSELLYMMGFDEFSRTQCDLALASTSDPELQSSVHCMKGINERVKGNMTSALVCFRKAVELNPQNYKAYLPLVELIISKYSNEPFYTGFKSSGSSSSGGSASSSTPFTVFTAAGGGALGESSATASDAPLDIRQSNIAIDKAELEELVKALEECLPTSSLAKGPTLDRQERLKKFPPSDVYYALFMLYDTLGDYEKAYTYLSKGRVTKRIARASSPFVYNREKSIQASRSLLTVFAEGFWPKNTGHPSKSPVFIVGLMRCGSALLERILDSHSRILGIGEDSIFNASLPAARDDIVGALSSDELVREVVHKQGELLKKGILERAVKMHGIPLSKMTDDSYRIVDKMLFNYKNIGFIHLIFPNATIIHITRDPLDLVFSCIRWNFDDNGLEFTLDNTDMIIEYLMYLDVMRHWRKVLPGRIVDVSYEELVHRPVPVLRNLLETHLGLPFEESILNFHERAFGTGFHTGNSVQVRNPVNVSAVGGWKVYKHQLQSLIDKLRPGILDLASRDGLPFPETNNWPLDENHRYPCEKN